MKRKVTVRYRGCTTIAEIHEDGEFVAEGAAHWNPEDPYDKKLGKGIAVGRATKKADQRKAEQISETDARFMAAPPTRVEIYREALLWIAENEPHTDEGPGPHEGCARCFAQHRLDVADMIAE